MGWIDVGVGGRSLRRLFALGIAAALASTGTSRALPAGFKRGGRVNRRGLIAGAPISWGVIEIPDWGHQMDRDRVLREAAAVGFEAMEAGPEGFLPQDPAEISAALSEHGLGLVGGFVPAVLHEPGISWKELFENVSRAEEVASRFGVTVVVHSHYGTVIESDDQLWRFLEGCDTGLCLDTGHLVIGGSDPVEVAEQGADRVKHVHLKDVDREVAGRLGTREIGFEEAARSGAFRPLGEGDVDIGRLVELLEGAEYSRWYVLEQDIVVENEPEEGEGPVNDVRKSVRFIETCLDGSR